MAHNVKTPSLSERLTRRREIAKPIVLPEPARGKKPSKVKTNKNPKR